MQLIKQPGLRNVVQLAAVLELFTASTHVSGIRTKHRRLPDYVTLANGSVTTKNVARYCCRRLI